MTARTWHSGPPPHVGWWNASTIRAEQTWRWWNGFAWSCAVPDTASEAVAGFHASCPTSEDPKRIKWTDHYPENARVPRIDPRAA